MPHFMTITKVYGSGRYDGIFPGFALTTSGVKHEVGIKESDIVDRAYTADMLYVGRPEHEVAATFHVTRLRRARVVASTRNSTNYFPEEDLGYLLHQERIAHPYEYHQAASGGGGGAGSTILNVGPEFAYDTNGQVAAALEESLTMAHSTRPVFSENPEPHNNARINNNEDPKPLNKGGRRRTKAKKRKFKRSTRKHK